MSRILIVSPEPFLRQLIRFSLAELDAEVYSVEGVEAFERLTRRLAFDVVIFLQTTPFLTGGEWLSRLRPTTLRPPIIYVIAWQQSEEVVLSLLEQGVTQYLSFPISLPRLRVKVARQLRATP